MKRKTIKSVRVNTFLLKNIEMELNKINKPYNKNLRTFTDYLQDLLIMDYKNNFLILRKRKSSRSR
jgi:hypothetical protein